LHSFHASLALILLYVVQESTISVDLLMSESLTLASGDTAYTFEYDLNSTRGRKRILNLVTISKARLFIVNGQCKCVEDGCPEGEVTQLRSIVSSFQLR
jgi:PsbP